MEVIHLISEIMATEVITAHSNFTSPTIQKKRQI